MRVLVLGLDRSTPDRLFGDDRLVTLRHLMEAGLNGRLDGGAADLATRLRDEFARAGRRTSSARGFEGVRDAIPKDDWDLLTVADDPEDDRAFDDAVAGLLDLLDEETVLLIVSGPGAFVLAGPGVPALGEVEGARAIDLVPTLVALVGIDIPNSMPGRVLIPAEDVAAPFFRGYTADEESALLGRLSGLGYI